MANFEEKTIIDLISVTRINTIEVRHATVVLKDGEEISKTYHRHVVAPGDDLSTQDAKVVAVAQSIWTPEIVQQYKQLMDGESINLLD
jgi:hypothetical protein